MHKGEYGGIHDDIVINLDLTCVFLMWQQWDGQDVSMFTKQTKQKCKPLVANIGKIFHLKKTRIKIIVAGPHQ